jgi:hypothetical protein
MEFVQVEKASLLEYVAYVEALIADHNKLTKRLKDTEEILRIIEKTTDDRLGKVLDLILDQTNRSKYYEGLYDAYNIMKRGKVR